MIEIVYNAFLKSQPSQQLLLEKKQTKITYARGLSMTCFIVSDKRKHDSPQFPLKQS